MRRNGQSVGEEAARACARDREAENRCPILTSSRRGGRLFRAKSRLHRARLGPCRARRPLSIIRHKISSIPQIGSATSVACPTVGSDNELTPARPHISLSRALSLFRARGGEPTDRSAGRPADRQTGRTDGERCAEIETGTCARTRIHVRARAHTRTHIAQQTRDTHTRGSLDRRRPQSSPTACFIERRLSISSV